MLLPVDVAYAYYGINVDVGSIGTEVFVGGGVGLGVFVGRGV